MFFFMPAEISAVLACFWAPPFFGCSAPCFGCSVAFFGCSGCSWATISAAGVKNSVIAAAMISLEIIYEFLRFYFRLLIIGWMDSLLAPQPSVARFVVVSACLRDASARRFIPA